MNSFKMRIKKIRQNDSLIFVFVVLAMLIFRVWIITGIPKAFFYSPHDDLYFVKAAHYIIHGQWLGPYNQMTIIKVPFYSFFIVLSFLTGLPLFINETLLFLVACIVLYYSLVPLIKNHWWRLLLVALILFSPASLATRMTIKVYRDFVYYSVTLFVIACSIGLFLRLDKKISTLFFWSLGLGLSMGIFMITREEGIWIYPILFLLLLCNLLIIWLRIANQKLIRSFLVILPILLWYIPSFVVSYQNYNYYGFWGTTETTAPDFNRVLNILDRIEVSGAWHPTIQIPQEARMKAYEVSPLFNSLEDQIEGLVPSWNIHDDRATLLKPDWYITQYTVGGSEISNGHFLWLLRDAIYSEGYLVDGKYPHAFYESLGDQLEMACNDGRLECSTSVGIPLVGTIDKRHYSIILRMFLENIFHLLNQDSLKIVSLDIRTWTPWPENYEEYKYFQEFVYNSIYSPGIHSSQDTEYIVNGKLDLRLKILQYKEKIMVKIANMYKSFTFPAFVIGFISFIVLVFLSLSKKHNEFQGAYLVIAVFLVGLFFSRLMTLSIVDATTSASGMLYSTSNYLFIYLFSFLMLYWMIKQLITLRQK